MNIHEANKLAVQSTPRVSVKVFPDYHRHDIVKVLKGKNNIGIELGVAAGHYSKRMVKSNKFKHFFGVDLYEDHHNTEEYVSALKLVGIEESYTLLRMSFDDAISLFDDNFFDFIYFDGYAHTGEEGGKTFADWYKKLRVGGIFAGDDYHDDWPLVKWAVNDMVEKLGCSLSVTGRIETTHLNKYPSWFFEKKSEVDFSSNDKLQKLGMEIRKATRKNSGDNIQLTAQQIANLLNDIKINYPILAEQLKQLL
jgi:hypothetical protein